MMVDIVAVMLISIVVESHAVELFKGIGNFTHWCSKTGVQGDAFCLGSTNVHALTLLHVSEVRCFHPAALVGNNWRLRVSQQCPLCWPEKRMRLDIGCTSP